MIADMKSVPLDQLPVGDEDRRALAGLAGVHGALWAGGKAVVFGPACTLQNEAEAVAAHPGATLVWHRVAVPNRAAAALALMAEEGITAFAAAKRVGVHVSAVYRAQALREERGVCPCCGQPLPTQPGAL